MVSRGHNEPVNMADIADLEAVKDFDDLIRRWNTIKVKDQQNNTMLAVERLTGPELCRLSIVDYEIDMYTLYCHIENGNATPAQVALYRQAELWEQIRLCMWTRDGTRFELKEVYDRCADRIISGIKSMRLDGLDLMLDWAALECGYGVSSKPNGKVKLTWLDAKFAYYVIHRGQHVATISFDPLPSVLLLSQVQMRKSKGNRWLYQFGGHAGFVSAVIRALEGAFACPVALIEGETAKSLVLHNHRRDLKPEHEAEAARVGAFYGGKIEGYQRTGTFRAFGGQLFTTLERVEALTQAA